MQTKDSWQSVTHQHGVTNCGWRSLSFHASCPYLLMSNAQNQSRYRFRQLRVTNGLPPCARREQVRSRCSIHGQRFGAIGSVRSLHRLVISVLEDIMTPAWGCSAVVARSLCMRKVQGSIPCSSNVLLFFFSSTLQICICIYVSTYLGSTAYPRSRQE